MSKVPCVRCGTDCTGEDDYEKCYLGDIYLEGISDITETEIDLCERCKQGLDTLVEKYLKNEKEQT